MLACGGAGIDIRIGGRGMARGCWAERSGPWRRPGNVIVLSDVAKSNEASLRTHLRCGFRREAEQWTEAGRHRDRQALYHGLPQRRS